jgi:hypothetical protein
VLNVSQYCHDTKYNENQPGATEEVHIILFFFFLNHPLLPCGVEGFLLVNL